VAGTCVAAGAGAVDPAGGAIAGGGAVGRGARPLLAAIGAAAHVPTQWSGAGAAWAVAAVNGENSNAVASANAEKFQRKDTVRSTSIHEIAGRTILLHLRWRRSAPGAQIYCLS